MAEHADIKVEIEIDIKQEFEDIYIKQEPFEETILSCDSRDLETIRNLKTVSSGDVKNLEIIPYRNSRDRYLEHEIKQETVAGPVLFQKSEDYQIPDRACNDVLEVKPLVQEIINQIQNRVSEGNCEQAPTKCIVENKSKLDPKRPTKVTGPYFCEFCHKEFQHVSKLKRHMPVHTGQRPYICHICGKRFGESSYLKLHMLMHKGEKVFACQLCDKRFTHGSNLKRHQLTHTGERPYICEVCNKGYSDRSTLKQHRRIHDGEKPYVCEVCLQGFPQSSQLKKHIMKHGAQPLFSNL